MRTPLFAAGFLCSGVFPLAAQAFVTGTVREDSTGRPLGGVEVLIEDSKRRATTDSAGRYLLESPTGNRVVLFQLARYHSVRIRIRPAKRDTVPLDATLVRQSAQELPAIEVKARAIPPPGSVLAGFEERRRLGFGSFLDSTELRRSDGRKLTDVLRGRTGIRIVAWTESGQGGPPEYRAASVTGMNEGDYCWVTVILDGIPIYKAGSRSMRPPDLSRDFPVSSLMAIEYYRGSAGVPTEFGVGRDTDCGVLALWTRRKS